MMLLSFMLLLFCCRQTSFHFKINLFYFQFFSRREKNFSVGRETNSGNISTMSIPGDAADYSSPKLRGYLEVKHCPTNGRSRARIPRKVRNVDYLYLYTFLNDELSNRCITGPGISLELFYLIGADS